MEFKLSAVLAAHESAVRDVAVSGNNLLAVAEERGKVGVWERTGVKNFTKKDIFPEKMHQGLAFCVAHIAADWCPADSFFSGGNDKLVMGWSAAGEGLHTYAGHTDCVNCISQTTAGDLLTGGWDGTVKVWRDGKVVLDLKGMHQHATEAVGLATGEIVTGSTNKNLVMYDGKSGRLLRTIPDAHDHAIRKLVLHPLGFASCSNDGTVKVWSNQGDLLVSINAHVAGSKFVYGLCVLPSGELVSSGEDACVRVWSADGQLVQTIQHPGPVRSVKVFPNGDIATACADGSARIFTRVAAREGDADIIAHFTDLIQQVMASGGMEELDPSSMEKEDALLVPGQKDGQLKVINLTGKGPMVFKWDLHKMEWELIGEALGRAQNKKTKLPDGSEWDVVTDVFVDETRAVPMGFNKDEDPLEVADRFCNQYGVSNESKLQIIAHVSKQVDPVLGQHRKQREKEEKAQAALFQVPSWKTGAQELYSQPLKTDAWKKKMAELNEQFVQQGDTANALTASELNTLTALGATLTEVKNFHVSAFPSTQLAVMCKLLTWPSSCMAPVLDAYRVCMLHQDACDSLGNTAQAQQALLALCGTPGSDTNLIMLMRGLCNFLSKRKRTPQERGEGVLPDQLQRFMQDLVATLIANASHPNATLTANLVTLLYDIVLWLGSVNAGQNKVYTLMLPGLVGVLQRADLSDKAKFYAFISLGSIAFISPLDRGYLTQAPLAEPLAAAIKRDMTAHAPNTALHQVCADVIKLLK